MTFSGPTCTKCIDNGPHSGILQGKHVWTHVQYFNKMFHGDLLVKHSTVEKNLSYECCYFQTLWYFPLDQWRPSLFQ